MPLPSSSGATFVNTMTRSRMPSIACPTVRSDVPSPYTSAVSIHVMPASIPARMASTAWAAGWMAPQLRWPACQPPYPTTEISGPPLPSGPQLHEREAYTRGLVWTT